MISTQHPTLHSDNTSPEPAGAGFRQVLAETPGVQDLRCDTNNARLVEEYGLFVKDI